LPKGIIFDFDGVIVESVKIKTDAFATLYLKYGDDIINSVIEHHQSNGGMSRFEKIKLYHETFLNKSVSNEELKILANKFSELVVKKVIAAPYVKGALEYISSHYNKCSLFISTGTPTHEIKQILHGRRIDHYFTEVFGSPEEKTYHVNNIKLNYGMKPNDLLFFGDSLTDLDAAKQAGIPFILIKNDYNKNLINSYKGKAIKNFKGLS
tara:strand:+ start:59318 stop:59944 length:627 start_codon:yes stop_codon:yes gene_type:complete